MSDLCTDNRWFTTHLSLDVITSSDEMFTEASFNFLDLCCFLDRWEQCEVEFSQCLLEELLARLINNIKTQIPKDFLIGCHDKM